MHILRLSAHTVYIKLSNFILFSLENDDMKSSKRCVKLLSLIFTVKKLIENTWYGPKKQDTITVSDFSDLLLPLYVM